MAITYPRQLPDLGVEDIWFEPERVDLVTPENSGRLRSVTAGDPLWKLVLTLGRDDEDSGDEWRAWKDSLDGAGRQFYGRDISRPLPKAYIATGLPGGWDGDADDWSVNTDRDVLTLDLGAARAGFVLTRMDYVGFRWSAGVNRTLVRCLEGATANGSGVVSVTVRPAVPVLVPDAATAMLDEPSCLMRLLLAETSIEPKDGAHEVSGRIAAIQDLVE